MKAISFWASRHIVAARWLLIAVKTALGVLAYYTGLYLYKSNIILPGLWLMLLAVILLIAGIALYPSTVKKKYALQKTGDVLMGLAAFICITSMVNNAGVKQSSSSVYAGTYIVTPTAQEILASGKTKSELTRKEKRILKREFFEQIKVLAVAKVTGDKQKSGEAVKILLAIIGLLGLLYLLAALACSLSCNGNETAAIIVGVLGLAGLIWAFIAVIRGIERKKKAAAKSKDE